MAKLMTMLEDSKTCVKTFVDTCRQLEEEVKAFEGETSVIKMIVKEAKKRSKAVEEKAIERKVILERRNKVSNIFFFFTCHRLFTI